GDERYPPGQPDPAAPPDDRHLDRGCAEPLVAVLGATGAGRRGDRAPVRAPREADARAKLAATGLGDAAADRADLLLAPREGAPFGAAAEGRNRADRRGQRRQRRLVGAARPLRAPRPSQERRAAALLGPRAVGHERAPVRALVLRG